jgi:LysM repeat protein
MSRGRGGKPHLGLSLGASDLIAEVNALRASNGLPAYNVDSILMQIAQDHSEYQASIGTTTHYGADGSRPFQRALAAGYPVAGELSRGGFFAENITSGSNKTAAQVVLEWQSDSTHLSTMLSSNLQDAGAGVAVSGGITYYTLDAGLSTNSIPNYTPPTGDATSIPGTPGTIATLEIVQPVTTNTPIEDGSLIHVVKTGEALWSIALAYGTTIDELKRINQLASNEIYVGQKLLIRKDAPLTITPEESTTTVTLGVPLSTTTKPLPSTATFTSTPQPAPPTTPQSGGVAVAIIIVGALAAAGIGTWLSKKK